MKRAFSGLDPTGMFCFFWVRQLVFPVVELCVFFFWLGGFLLQKHEISGRERIQVLDD